MTEQNGQARGHFFEAEDGDPLEELAQIVSGEKQTKPKPRTDLRPVDSAPAPRAAPVRKPEPAPKPEPVQAAVQADGDADSMFEMELMSQLGGDGTPQPVREQAVPNPAQQAAPQAEMDAAEDEASLEDQLMIDMGLAMDGGETDNGSGGGSDGDFQDQDNRVDEFRFDDFNAANDFKETFEAELAIDRAANALRRDAGGSARTVKDDELAELGFLPPSAWDVKAPREQGIFGESAPADAESLPINADAWNDDIDQDQAASDLSSGGKELAGLDFDAAFNSEMGNIAPEPAAPQRAPAPVAPAFDAYDAGASADIASPQETNALAPLRQPVADAAPQGVPMFTSEREVDDHFASVFAEELALEESEPADQDYDPDAPLVARQGAGRQAIRQHWPDEADEFADPAFAAEDQSEADYSYNEDYEGYDAAPDTESGSRSASGGFRLAAIALGLALVVGLGAVSYGFFKGSQTTSEPAIVRADTDPVKEKPEDPGGATVANQDQAAYDRVAGKFGEEATQEKLVTTTEEPLNLVSAAPPVDAGEALNGAENKAEARLAPGEAEDAVSPITLQPRRVRTVAVLRDGTIVSPSGGAQTDGTTAGSETAFASTQGDAAANSIDGARSTGEIPVPLQRPEFGQSSRAAPARTVSTTPVRVAPVTPETTPATSAASEPVSNGLPGVAFTPTVIPVPSSEQSTDPVNTQSVSPTTTASTAPAVSDAPLSDWVIQISSQRTPEAAEASYQNLLGRFPDLLQGRKMAIRKADLDDRGIFYRVRIQSSSKDDANNFCQQLRNAGGSCFVTH